MTLILMPSPSGQVCFMSGSVTASLMSVHRDGRPCRNAVELRFNV